MEDNKKKQKTKKNSLESQVQEYKELLQRLQAEFDNTLKRAEKERMAIKDRAAHEVLARLLIIIDDFEHALKSINSPETKKEDIVQGVQLICSKLHKLLEAYGVKPIEAIGLNLDPFKHEVIQMSDSQKPEGVILEELQKGYEFHGGILRPSKVIVAKHIEKSDQGGKQNGKGKDNRN